MTKIKMNKKAVLIIKQKTKLMKAFEKETGVDCRKSNGEFTKIYLYWKKLRRTGNPFFKLSSEKDKKPTIKGMKKIISDILKKNRETLADLKKKGYMKVKNTPYMDLNVDYLGKLDGYDHFSVAHNFVQNGDLMADPDMEFIDSGQKWIPISWQLDSVGLYHTARSFRGGRWLVDTDRQRELKTFANKWATRLRKQGFIKGKVSH